MAQIIRRIASMKMNNRGVQSSRSKDQETWKNTMINKERDKLLQEFLLAREELKAQFDLEKREIVGNYERRMRYLRRLLEDCDENINMLKLNLDAEKEENFLLKTKIMELESKCNKQNAEIFESPNKSIDIKTSYLNQSYDKESTIKSYPCSRESSVRKSTCTFLTDTPERSSIDGLKYSDRFASCGSIGNESCFTSISTIPSTVADTCNDTHINCRREFNRLLEELRMKEERFAVQLKHEKGRMREELENEKLQLERVVFRQLNIRLEREIKKQELLFTENAHLRRTISETIMERMQCRCRNITKSTDNTPKWKANSTDSGADVEDMHSDDGSDGSTDSGKGSLTFSQSKLSGSNENINSAVLQKLLENPFHCKKDDETNLQTLYDENKTNGNESEVKVDYLQEITDFSQDLQRRLLELEELLLEEDDGC